MAPSRYCGAALAVFCATWMNGSSQAADYQRYQNGACAAASLCNINYPVVPAGRTLRLSNLSCYLRFSNLSRIYGAQLLLLNASGVVIMAVTPRLAQQGQITVGNNVELAFASNDNIKVVATAGQRFRAYVDIRVNSGGAIGTVSQYACHISGDLT